MPDERSYFDFLSRITSKGDIGAAAIGNSVGIILDPAINKSGLEPLGLGGACGAALALGVKNSVQAAMDSSSQKRTLPKLDNLELAYRNLIDLLTERQLSQNITTLDKYHDLWRIKLLTDEEFKERMRALIIESPAPSIRIRKISSSE